MSDKAKPAVFRLDDPKLVVGEPEATSNPRGAIVLTPEREDFDAPAPELPRKRRSRWGVLLWSALGGLVSLAIGLSVTRLVEDLFARNEWLGWVGAALAALAVLAILVIAAREILALVRLNRIEALHDRTVTVISTDDRKSARALTGDLVQLYAKEPRMARARGRVEAAMGDIIDGADLMRIAERELMGPLDLEARRLIADSAKRVSLVTAVSPRAVVDILFVAAEALRLMRQLATLYGGRPGSLGMIRLFRHALGNLAVTGGLAVGDTLLSQVFGHGLAARISTKLGEGVLNGLLTARLGLAAMAVTRPMPFTALQRPGLTEVAGGLWSKDAQKD